MSGCSPLQPAPVVPATARGLLLTAGRRARRGAICALLAAVLVACGDDGNGDGATATTATTSTTSTTQATQRCANVGFTPNSDDVASDIVAIGLSCAEAEAVVRVVAAPLSATGPARSEGAGFTCVLTGRSTEALESATYECTSGTRRITFRRT